VHLIRANFQCFDQLSVSKSLEIEWMALVWLGASKETLSASLFREDSQCFGQPSASKSLVVE